MTGVPLAYGRLVLIAVAFVCVVCAGSAGERQKVVQPAQRHLITPAVAKLERMNFQRTRLKAAQLKGLTEAELKQLRGIIFGKRGRVFGEKEIQNFLVTRPWYRPSKSYEVSQLNSRERANMDAIKEAEWRLHKQIEPGNLKFYRKRLFTEAQAGKHTPTEWRLMRAEIEAIHGKRFRGEIWLQSFFDERYWYDSNYDYNIKQLSRIERKNLATLIAAEKRQRGIAVLPGEMPQWSKRLLSPTGIRGLTLHELRLLRNEVFALHKHSFGDSWLTEYFYGLGDEAEDESESWTPTRLTVTDEKNVATILLEERRLREELAAHPLSDEDLIGLTRQEAALLRYEIEARRGKVFANKALQKHFKVAAWYRPNPAFRLETLAPQDKRNLALLKEFEKKASRAAEGEAA